MSSFQIPEELSSHRNRNYSHGKLSTHITRNHGHGHGHGHVERGIFRATKELCRFVMTTIVVANATKCTASAASIITNYHKTAAARSSRKSADMNEINNMNMNMNNKSRARARSDMNLWHFRTFSTCGAGTDSSLFGDSATSSAIARRGGSSKTRKGLKVVKQTSLKKKKYTSKRNREDANLVEDPFNDPTYQPSIEELRAQLGPIGRLVANSVEVGVTTAGSYMSGGLFGYLIGGVSGVPALFKNSAETATSTATQNASANARGGLSEIQRRVGSWNSHAFARGKSWGEVSASFSGFHALTRAARGGVEDRWNGIVGSAFAGAYLSRKGGPQAMLQGAYSYAGFTYVLDVVFAKGAGKKGGDMDDIDGEFAFTDTPVDDRGY